jgi:hypothetical protein
LIKYRLISAASSIEISKFSNQNQIASLIDVDEHSGEIYLSSSINSTQLYEHIINRKDFMNNHNELLLKIQVEATNFVHKSTQQQQQQQQQQQHVKQAKSLLNMKLQFLACSNLDVRLERSYYHYQISESIRPRTVFGLINSAQHLYIEQNHNTIVYSIIDGDYMDQFEIDYKTGKCLSLYTVFLYFRSCSNKFFYIYI